MSLRLFETIHGHFGVLAAAALLHPAILLRKGKPLTRGMQLAVVLSTTAVVLAFATGLWIYPSYRDFVRPSLFRASARAGFLFETKEHLAFAVMALSIGACACVLLAPREARALRKAAAASYAVGAGLCVITVCLGSYIASVQGFSSAPP
ncbi:MAG TPA: hypothetical protein VFB62_24065 [Polyangiaceae bacterium]|nr:hypothetical protein [Polyangiaceae bacterium]